MRVRQPAQRRNIHMVVVIVTDEHQVDGGQQFEGEPGRMYSPRPGPLHGAGALAIHGVGQDIHSGQLDQKGHVIDEGDRHFAAVERFGHQRHASILAPARP